MKKAGLLACMTLALAGCVSKPPTPATLKEIQSTPKTNYEMSDYVKEGLEDISVVFDIEQEVVYSLADTDKDKKIVVEEYYDLMRRVQVAVRNAMNGTMPLPELPYDEGLEN